MAKIKQCHTIRPSIRGLRVGQKVSFPIARHNAVSVTAYNLAMELNRSYSTMRDRENGVIIVTRNS